MKNAKIGNTASATATDSKKVNYSQELTAKIVSAYTSAKDDTARAEVLAKLEKETGKSKRSLVGKLNREGVYVKPTATTKTGGKIERKADIVDDIAKACKVDADMLGSLESATKIALETVRASLAVSVEGSESEG